MSKNIIYRFLNKDDLSIIHEAFHKAFADYQVDVSYMTKEVMYNRFIKNNVQYDLSIGAFADDKIIGFTMVGVDTFKNKLTAFDVMTGIVKDYRGLGAAKEMFEFTLPKLNEKKIEKFVLEVLRPNENAIKAYKKSGFEIVRDLDCFELSAKDFIADKKLDVETKLRLVSREKLYEFSSEITWAPSWENSFAGINRIENEVKSIGAFINGNLVGILIYYPTINWLMQLIVKKEYRRKGIATALLNNLLDQLPEDIERFYFHNIESSQTGSKEFLKGCGFKEIIGQYEMELTL